MMHRPGLLLAMWALLSGPLPSSSSAASASPPPADPGYRVHPSPGGGTLCSPWYVALVGPADTASPSFVWYTSVANRQPILPGNNVPSTATSKDTSFTIFDLSRPTLVTVLLRGADVWDHGPLQNPAGPRAAAHLSAPTVITEATVLPSSSGITASISADRRSVSFTVDRPRQVCLIINRDMDVPFCVFADPPEVDPPTGPDPASGLIYFGPGVHRVPGDGAINVTANQSVYIAGGAHVYGQVRAVGVYFSGNWVGGEPCDNVRVFGRGVLDGHAIPINFRAHAMIELPACANIVVEGVTTIDSPQYQLNNEVGPGGRVSFAKAIAWGFTTDGWSAGAYSVVEDSFQKVNDDSTKLFGTGALVQRSVFWQMENGCPFMLSWYVADNVGFVTARDNDVIANEKTRPSAVDGIICAFHGGGGNLNNWLFDDIRVENCDWALLAVTIGNNPWGTAKQIGSISTILIRNLSSALPFRSPTPFRVAGNSSAGARVDRVVYEGVTIAGQPLTLAEVQRGGGLGEFVTNVSVCAQGCGDQLLPPGAAGWSRDEVCGRSPQPCIAGRQLPPLTRPGLEPYCRTAAEAVIV